MLTHIAYERISYKGQLIRMVVQTDPLGNIEVKVYDTHHRLINTHRRNSLGQATQSENHTYDAKGQRLQTRFEVYSADASLRHVTTEWQYDTMGNIIQCTEAKDTPEQKSTRFLYNSFGQKEQIIKPDGSVLVNRYDLLGRLIRYTSSDHTIDYAYTYDIKDHPILIEDKIHDTTTTRAYDTHGRLISETLDNGLTLSYTYDAQDRLSTLTLPDQSLVQYTYNAHYLTAIDRIKGNQIVYSHRYTDYDQAENLLRMELPGQAGTTDFQYDLLQRLTLTNAPQWQETVPANGYDPVGNLLQRTVSDAQGALDYTYTYDDLYQLDSESGLQSHTYQHDSLYNRIAKNDQPYAINDLNQLLEQTDTTYTYDANGNLAQSIQGDETTSYRYDALDRLIQIEKGSSLVTYRYDSLHRRLSKVQNGLTTHYLYQKDDEIGAVIDQEITELRILGLGKGAEIGAAVSIELNGTPYVPIHDPYGNVVTLLDLSGDVVASYRYTAFGEEEISGSAQTLGGIPVSESTPKPASSTLDGVIISQASADG